MSSTVHTPLFDAAYLRDPYAVYARLRHAGPVHRAVTPNGVPVWVVTDYAEVRAALGDPRLAKNAVRLRGIVERLSGVGSDDVVEPIAGNMLNSDPPEHTRLRRLVSKAFTPRRVEGLRPRVERIAGELIDAFDAGPLDVIDAFAFPLPIAVICELLGIPDTDRDAFRRWSNAVVGSGDPARARRASIALGGYLMQVVAAKRAAPADDLLSDLIEVVDGGDRLSAMEMVSMAMLLLIAGHETTVNLIGNGLLALLRNPSQLAAIRADPGLLPGAVEELLRYEPPAPVTTMRYTAEPVTVGGHEIPADEIVLLALGAANRDERAFGDPDVLDIRRAAGAHLSFGHGIHYCMGAPLARMEAQVALGALIERFPEIALAVDPGRLRWRSSVIMRSLVGLPVHLKEGTSHG